MPKLVYTAITSLDGYTADADGGFDWSAPDAEVHAHVNDAERAIGTYLYGRRMYEVMRAWESMPLDDEPEVIRDYAAIWRAADKIVYSSTLDAVSTKKTVLEHEFDADAVRALKAAAHADLGIGGPTLAAHAIRAGLVDEYNLYVCPIIVGGGLPGLPSNANVRLTLLESRTFGNGVVFSRYAVAS